MPRTIPGGMYKWTAWQDKGESWWHQVSGVPEVWPAGAEAVNFPAHTLWHSSKIKAAHCLSATLCWRAFCLPVEAHWGHIQVKSKPLESTLNQWWMQSGWTNAPVPLPISCNNSVSQDDLTGRSPVAWVINLLTHCLLASFPSLSHFSTPYKCFLESLPK